MKHVKALFIKFTMLAVVLGLVLTGGFNVSFGDSMLVSAVLTLSSYLLGDLLIFKKSTANAMTISDPVAMEFLLICSEGSPYMANGKCSLSSRYNPPISFCHFFYYNWRRRMGIP